MFNYGIVGMGLYRSCVLCEQCPYTAH